MGTRFSEPIIINTISSAFTIFHKNDPLDLLFHMEGLTNSVLDEMLITISVSFFYNEREAHFIKKAFEYNTTSKFLSDSTN